MFYVSIQFLKKMLPILKFQMFNPDQIYQNGLLVHNVITIVFFLLPL